MDIRRPQLTTTAFVLVAAAIITACPHATPATSRQPVSGAVESAGVTLTNLEPPGAFEVTNIGSAPIELLSTVAIESMNSGAWAAGPESPVELIEACGRPAPRCVRIEPGARLRPPAWSGWLCSGQCPEATDCKKNPYAAGTHRFVLTSCDGTQRFTGPAFTLTGPTSANAPSAIAASHDVSGSYEGGSECLPHGDIVELKGVLVVEPFGKGIDGARLVAGDGERWILNYGARGVYRELDGKRVTARGRACDMQGEAIMGRHFDPATLTVD
ncbi:hypothetical protein [Nannocystis radixulma]|uniref:Uncharacterized protein n=1 Tax=Nannocystis radixulma TaxID=2995305 RepID=A0ABT5BLD6_9BACT|nr:hypothetical protein [Nannocystis radixulma]MDC0674493.1 hypothetical protein [Nannocystis radixulma]